MVIRAWNSIELCAGVGGLGLGVSIAEPGHRTVAYVEREAYAAGLLVARMEAGELDAAPVWSDLATFDGRPWRGRVHLVTSGDPCQPNSNAGKRLGADDDRFLAEQVLRVVDEVRPIRFWRENVTGNAHGQLEAFVPSLERMGFRVAARIVRARDVGAAHLRERLFIMADADGVDGNAWSDESGLSASEGTDGLAGRSGQHLGNATGSRWDASPAGRWAPEPLSTGGSSRELANPIGEPIRGRRSGQNAGTASDTAREEREQRLRSDAGQRGADVGDALCEGSQRLGPGNYAIGRQEPDGHAGLSGGARVPSPASLSLGRLFAPGPSDPVWAEICRDTPTLEPAVRRVAHGMANRVDELRACGNGVVSLAAAYAWRTLDALHVERRAAEAVLKWRAA